MNKKIMQLLFVIMITTTTHHVTRNDFIGVRVAINPHRVKHLFPIRFRLSHYIDGIHDTKLAEINRFSTLTYTNDRISGA